MPLGDGPLANAVGIEPTPRRLELPVLPLHQANAGAACCRGYTRRPYTSSLRYGKSKQYVRAAEDGGHDPQSLAPCRLASDPARLCGSSSMEVRAGIAPA
jgi:hypothetical protein